MEVNECHEKEAWNSTTKDIILKKRELIWQAEDFEISKN